ncbi:MAG: TonB-dependent receptor [Pseudomonadota bacterium]
MRSIRNSTIFTGVTALTLGLGSAPAVMAQQPTAPAGETDATDLQEVVVIGIRASLESAQELKRDAPSVVEAVTPKDLGQFTDAALSQSLTRVPGLQVYQNAQPQYGGGSGVSIRGLGPDFVATTVNGRNVLGQPESRGGGTGRNFDFDSLSPEVVSGILVYKSPTAELVEPGLAGEVDIQTLKPLDYRTPDGENFFGSVQAQGIYQSERSKTGPRYSGVLGAKLLDDTLGVYVAALASDEYQQSKQNYVFWYLGNVAVQNAGGGTTNYENILFPGEADSLLDNYHYIRRGTSVGLQWRPADSRLEVNVDALYSRFSTLIEQSTFQNYTGFGIFAPVTFLPGGATIVDGQMTGFDTTKTVDGFPTGLFSGRSAGLVGGFVDNTNANRMLGGNIKWRGDSYTLSVDYAHNTLTYAQDFNNAYWPSSGTDETAIDGAYDFTGFKYTAHYYGDNLPSNPALWSTAEDASNGLGYYAQQTYWHTDRDQARADLSWNLSDAFTLKGGVRFETTNVRTASGFGTTGVNPYNGVNSFTLFSTPGDPSTGYYTTDGLLSGKSANLPGAPDVPLATRAGFASTNPFAASLTNFGRGGSFYDCPSPITTSDPISLQPITGSGAVYCLKEKTSAAYVQVDYKGTIGQRDWSANVGVRALRVEESASGLQFVNEAISDPGGSVISTTSQPGEGETSYWNYLPSLNVLFKPRANINLRFGFARTITLPSYTAMAPSGTATYYQSFNGVQYPNTFYGGNLYLKPTEADNFDLTAEYYTSYGGAIIVSAFRKNLSDFNVGLTQLGVPVPGLDGLFNSGTTINGGSGHSSGVEVGTNQPFTFLPSPWDGLGVTANYTRVSSQQTLETANGTISGELPGTAKDNVNAQLYYEKYGFAVRLAFNYRGDTTTSPGGTSYEGHLIDDGYIKGYETIDLSLSKRFLDDHFEVIATGTNLTNAEQIAFIGPAKLLTQYNPLPRIFTLGVRARF